jgi:glycerophosphoryl diester phosphodiesterase
MKKHNRRSFLTQGAVVTVGSLAARTLARPTSRKLKPSPRWQDHPFFAGAQRPDVIAHRGGSGHWPGETMYAMTEAVSVGADVLEMDVFLTKGGTDENGKVQAPELVLMHDIEVAKTTEGNRKVYEYRIDEIQKLDASFHWIPNHTKTDRNREGSSHLAKRGFDVTVPTLERVFKQFPNTRMVIEMKKAPDEFSPVPRLVELISKYEAEKRVLIASFKAEFMSAFRKALPRVATSFTISLEDSHRALKQLLGLQGEANGPVALQIPWEAMHLPLNKPIIDKLRRQLAIHPWTVNKPGEMERLISVSDGIITDYPCILLDKLNRRPPQSKPCS